jgi:hypothetical protein
MSISQKHEKNLGMKTCDFFIDTKTKFRLFNMDEKHISQVKKQLHP